MFQAAFYSTTRVNAAYVSAAVAYAWYVSTASGTETLQAITTLNSIAFTAPLSTGNQAATAITADNSANPNYAYDGLLTTALKAGSNAYVNTLPTGAVGVGTALTGPFDQTICVSMIW